MSNKLLVIILFFIIIYYSRLEIKVFKCKRTSNTPTGTSLHTFIIIIILIVPPLQILSWFGDSESELCPFSIHRLMEAAYYHGNKPGDWFGPSQVSILIRSAFPLTPCHCVTVHVRSC